jgi:hypothetical protein
MDISYLGQGSVKLSGKAINVLVDPKEGNKTAADVVLITGGDSHDRKYDKAMVIDGPGEYEVRGSMVIGTPVQLHVDEDGRAGTLYSVDIDDIRTVIVGNIAPKLDDRQLEVLGRVDVLVVPVGGHGLTLDAQAAAALVSQIEPKYVIPVHFDDGKSKYEMPQDKVDTFLKEVGSQPEPQAKLKLASRDLPEEMTVVLLELAA